MACSINRKPVKGSKALEMAMRDTMDGMADAACHLAYRSTPDTLEILSIEPPRFDPVAEPENRISAEIIHVNKLLPKQDIVEFLSHREERFERL